MLNLENLNLKEKIKKKQNNLNLKEEHKEKHFTNLEYSKQQTLYFKKKIKEKEKINPSSFSNLKYCELEDLNKVKIFQVFLI